MSIGCDGTGKYAKAARTLVAVASSLPTRELLKVEIEDGWRAANRGFFLPDEDERVRAVFSRYLGVRVALFETIEEVLREIPSAVGGGRVLGVGKPDEELKSFSVALCAACMLVRSAWFLVDHFATAPVIWKKLDEAEPRYGILPGQFSAIYRSLTRPAHVVRFFRALRFAREHEEEIGRLRDDVELSRVIGLLEKERPHVVELKRRTFAMERLSYWKHALLRRGRGGLRQISGGLFEVSGRVVAEMRNQFKTKRVSNQIREMLAAELQPGDVIVTRHDDAMSNLFLPGFWPHAALYVGTAEERCGLGIKLDEGGDYCVVEAKKDGIRWRCLEETTDVDAFCVVRPLLSDEDRRRVVERAISHVGKMYDFEFDFTRADRMVCTEVVYRSMHGVGGIEFDLSRRAGRLCLSAEQILGKAVEGREFEVRVVYGTEGNRWHGGGDAIVALSESLEGRETSFDATAE